MSDPLEKATAKAPPVIGDGCTRRYDPDSLQEEDGTEFPGARVLWQRYQEENRGEDIDPSDQG